MMSEIVEKPKKKLRENKEVSLSREKYCKLLFENEGKIESFFNTILHESIKLYDDIAPKIEKEDGSYGVDDLWGLITNLNEIISNKEKSKGDFYIINLN